ncbi:MAG: diacylglycerol kinase family protein [Terriglobia bacterium]
MRIIILLNPSAKRGKARRLLKRALDVFRQQNIHLEVRESLSAQHLMDLARGASNEKPDLIVSAGGDGTHHFVINGLFRSEIPLGLLPLGTGNDIAKGVGMPTDVHAAAAALLSGRVREIDLAQAGAAVYACIAGVGFDSTVTGYANQHARWLSGSAAYTWSLLRCLPAYSPKQLEIIADGKTLPKMWCLRWSAITLLTGVASGWRHAPASRMDSWISV